jgi:bile acid-coenzyme A ligase
MTLADPETVTGDAVGLGGAFQRLATVAPERDAIVCGATRVTWAQADTRSSRLARALRSRGVRAEQIVAMVLPNRVEHVELALACWKLGAIPLPLNWRMPDQERADIIAIASPALTVTQDKTHGGVDLEDLLGDAAREDDSPLPDVATAPWKAITSGGSTGRPKVILSIDGGPRSAGARALWSLRPWTASLIAGPLYFNGPFSRMTMTLLAGSTLVLMERFDAEEYLRLIQRERITWTLTVPTMWSRIMDLPADTRARHDLSSLEAVMHSGSPMAPWLKSALIELVGPTRVFEMYGATEVAGTMIRGDEWLEHPGSVGRPMPGYRIEIRDESGRVVAPGIVGEIWIRPPGAATFRYLGGDARVAEDGFVSVGDLGRMDEEGYLFIADRRTDLILSGGSNVYPAEVEGVLLEHPLVRDVVVVGIPDARWGQRVHAIVEPHDAVRAPTGADLDAFGRARLSSYKLPKTYEIVDAIPRDTAGKVRRQALRDERARAT